MDPIKAKLRSQKTRNEIGKESPKNWRHSYSRQHQGRRTQGIDGKIFDSSRWIYGREVKIFRLTGVNPNVVKYVELGLMDRIDNIGLDFKVTLSLSDSRLEEYVRNSLGEDNKIDISILSKYINTDQKRVIENNETPFGYVLLTPFSFPKDEDVNYEYWGKSFFSTGYIALSLPKKNQNSFGFIRKLTKHEAGHLFGLGEHHDDIDVQGYDINEECNMLGDVPTAHTCNKCLDAMVYFWKGIENRTGEKFFK